MTARKAKAAQACVDRFNGKSYAPGKHDCARLAVHLLHHLGQPVAMMKGRKYASEAAALKTLRDLGFASLVDAVDSLGLERIAPARAMSGDLVALPCDDERWGCALTVAVGNGRVFGFLDGVGQAVKPVDFVAAWRVV